ncbi:MAG: hypothetical protein WD530_03980 [Vicingaceae bacterium]
MLFETAVEVRVLPQGNIVILPFLVELILFRGEQKLDWQRVKERKINSFNEEKRSVENEGKVKNLEVLLTQGRKKYREEDLEGREVEANQEVEVKRIKNFSIQGKNRKNPYSVKW